MALCENCEHWTSMCDCPEWSKSLEELEKKNAELIRDLNALEKKGAAVS
jgi:hypothetical protein